MHEGKEELRRLGRSISPIGEATVALDFEPLRIVASAEKRWNAAEKEPYTVEWMARSLREHDVLYDIGANVGAYAMIGATVSPASVPVVAFEPAYDNYAALCANIVVNELTDRIVPLPVALVATTGLSVFRHWRLGTGTAQHDSVGETSWEAVYEQPMLSYRLDDVIEGFALPRPTYVKIDVDGAEVAVLEGAERTLASPELRELLVEIRPGDERVERLLDTFGFETIERHPTPAAVNIVVRRRS